ncbi:hypothetical protein BDA96_01G402300 [Sorghum bicolor]|uniref:Uncharacterized protein n=2 Tax=Sorghum bicolor TaxID=4558 RepID=A0A921S4D5_SORBI|nr:hypothetical protein BDA96_01G402300 [Sorghum bicolor]OQU92634.1 hypothetical protein SORBI_3001G378150 [Sorghum bicolor]
MAPTRKENSIFLAYKIKEMTLNCAMKLSFHEAVWARIGRAAAGSERRVASRPGERAGFAEGWGRDGGRDGETEELEEGITRDGGHTKAAAVVKWNRKGAVRRVRDSLPSSLGAGAWPLDSAARRSSIFVSPCNFGRFFL